MVVCGYGLWIGKCELPDVLEKTRKAMDRGRGKLLMGRENGAGEHNRLESLLRRTRYCLDKATGVLTSKDSLGD